MGLTKLELVGKLLQRFEDHGLSGVVEINFHRGEVKKISQTEVL